jgi:hypothetical protein
MKTKENILETTKEHLHLLHFPKEDVLSHAHQHRLRSVQLVRAMRLGNLLKNKVSIYFKDSHQRLIRINTTIWGVTMESVVLKKGVIIPIKSIVSVE